MATEMIPQANAHVGYYGLPLLKKPVWTWEVPLYLFVGGASGAASVIAVMSDWLDGDETIARDARWIAAGGSIISTGLLTADLGRPERLVNMLRVFKPQSAMSVGSWTLSAFSTLSATSAFASAMERRFDGSMPVRVVHQIAAPAAAMLGTVMSTYTGVLIGATAIPVWNKNVDVLPLHFGASGVASAVAMLELLGHEDDALQLLGIAAAAVETATGAVIEFKRGEESSPLRDGASGWLTRTGGVLSGPVPLALRAFAWHRPQLRRAAAASALAGSLLTRLAWIAAGRASAQDAATPLALPAAARVSLP